MDLLTATEIRRFARNGAKEPVKAPPGPRTPASPAPPPPKRRFAKAGSASDCGHESKGGYFSQGNTCASGSGSSDDLGDRVRRNEKAAESFYSSIDRDAWPISPKQWMRHALELAEDPDSVDKLRNLRASMDDKGNPLPESERLIASEFLDKLIGDDKAARPKRSRYDKLAEDQTYQDTCFEIFGREVHPKEIAQLVASHALGEAIGEKVKPDISVTPGKNPRINVHYEPLGGKVEMSRQIYRDHNGKLTIENETFFINDESLAGKGVGLKVFSNQVHAAIKMGVERMTCFAAGDYEKSLLKGREKMNGYVTWVKFGYDGYLDPGWISTHGRQLAALGINKKDIAYDRVKASDLQMTPERQEFWLKKGRGTRLDFDLTKGSESRRMLSAYRKKKGVDPADQPDRFQKENVPSWQPPNPDQSPPATNSRPKQPRKTMQYSPKSGPSGPPARSRKSRSPGRPVNATTSRYVKAGEPGDCGHRPVTGWFDLRNTCWMLKGSHVKLRLAQRNLPEDHPAAPALRNARKALHHARSAIQEGKDPGRALSIAADALRVARHHTRGTPHEDAVRDVDGDVKRTLASRRDSRPPDPSEPSAPGSEGDKKREREALHEAHGRLKDALQGEAASHADPAVVHAARKAFNGLDSTAEDFDKATHEIGKSVHERAEKPAEKASESKGHAFRRAREKMVGYARKLLKSLPREQRSLGKIAAKIAMKFMDTLQHNVSGYSDAAEKGHREHKTRHRTRRRPARLARAGDENDCGHRAEDGHFDLENTCQSLRPYRPRTREDRPKAARSVSPVSSTPKPIKRASETYLNANATYDLGVSSPGRSHISFEHEGGKFVIETYIHGHFKSRNKRDRYDTIEEAREAWKRARKELADQGWTRLIQRKAIDESNNVDKSKSVLKPDWWRGRKSSVVGGPSNIERALDSWENGGARAAIPPLPGTNGREAARLSRADRSRVSLSGPPVSRYRGYFREGGIDVPDHDDRLDRYEVGVILADQHGNKRQGIRPSHMRHKWVSSREFTLMEIPMWTINPYKFIEPDDPTYSRGPLIVDVNKRKPRPLLGSFGASPVLFILDGKHRYYEMRRAGKTHVQAYVGNLAVPVLTDLIERFGPVRKEFTDAVHAFYDDPSPVTQAYLMKAADDAGLTEAQTYKLIDNFYHGWVFDLASGEFRESENIVRIPS